MGPFSVTGQPNAMGGREVGGLANTLAAHMDIEDAAHRERVRRFWQLADDRREAGPQGRRYVPRRRRRTHQGAVDHGDQSRRLDAGGRQRRGGHRRLPVRRRLRRDRRHRHRALGARASARAAWGEKDGTVTNSERRISRQRSFLPLPGEARPDWWIVCEVGKRMGYGAAFDYASPAEIFAEHAALSHFENGGTRDFDIGALAQIERGAASIDLQPFQWPRAAGSSSRTAPLCRRTVLHRGREGPLCRGSRQLPSSGERPRSRSRSTPGRVRDHWHTMTRTGKSQRLSQHCCRAVRRDQSARRGTPSDRRRRPRPRLHRTWCRARPRPNLAAPAGAGRSSCLCTGTISSPLERASTFWCRPSPTLSRGSRRRRTSRRVSNGLWLRPTDLRAGRSRRASTRSTGRLRSARAAGAWSWRSRPRIGNGRVSSPAWSAPKLPSKPSPITTSKPGSTDSPALRASIWSARCFWRASPWQCRAIGRSGSFGAASIAEHGFRSLRGAPARERSIVALSSARALASARGRLPLRRRAAATPSQRSGRPCRPAAIAGLAARRSAPSWRAMCASSGIVTWGHSHDCCVV